jgi:hypothetical protein
VIDLKNTTVGSDDLATFNLLLAPGGVLGSICLLRNLSAYDAGWKEWSRLICSVRCNENFGSRNEKREGAVTDKAKATETLEDDPGTTSAHMRDSG